MENMNKVAGPFVEAWAVEIFQDISQDPNNEFQLIHVEAQERLYMADIILQFRGGARSNQVSPQRGCQSNGRGLQRFGQIAKHHLVQANPHRVH